MGIGLIGKKVGMTREFLDIGISIPVTVLYVEKGHILDVITKDKRGYDAIQIGFGKIKSSKLSKQMKGFFSKRSAEPKKILKEFRVNDTSSYKTGNEIGLEIFKDSKFVDVSSKTIGKGFAGSMKRHNFHGLRASHGVSVSHRSHGSTGQCQDPGRTFKGKKMAGHMGFRKITIHNLEIIEVNNEDGVLSIKGSVPGSKGSYVVIRDAIKPKSLTAKIKIHDESIEESKKMKKDSAESEEKKDTKDSKTGGEKK